MASGFEMFDLTETPLIGIPPTVVILRRVMGVWGTRAENKPIGERVGREGGGGRVGVGWRVAGAAGVEQ